MLVAGGHHYSLETLFLVPTSKYASDPPEVKDAIFLQRGANQGQTTFGSALILTRLSWAKGRNALSISQSNGAWSLPTLLSVADTH